MIEIIFYVVISGFIILASFSVLDVVNKSKVKNEAAMSVEQQGAVVMDKILGDIRRSEGAGYPLPGASNSGLSLVMNVPAESPTVYSYSEGTLKLARGMSSQIDILDQEVYMTSITFNNYSVDDAGDSIRVVFTIAYKNVSGKPEYDYSKTFYGTATTRR
jgi:hypothetical protein